MNYNSLMNKPTINYKELIGDNTVTEVGGITEEQFNTLLSTDLSSYYTKAQIDDLFSRSYVYREKSGHIVTFDCPSTSQSIPEVTVGIEATQDIHGYDYPWVGGAGKNKLPSISQTQTINGVTWTLQSDGSIKLSGTATANSVYDLGRAENLTLKSGSYFANENGTNYTVTIFRVVGGSASAYKSGGGAFSISEDTEIFMRVAVARGTSINETLYPMIESGSARTSYEPYSNECPISGWSSVNVYDGPTTDPQDATVYTTALKDANDQPLTCYGGQLENVNGVQTLVLTHGYIASYNGETLPSTWISDRDVYAEGTTPTIGAQVVYKLATPTEYDLSDVSISTQDGTNNLWADSGDIEVKCLDRIIPAGE
jgi:hypothetical protein